jgi:Flp pilus assembly protein TadD
MNNLSGASRPEHVDFGVLLRAGWQAFEDSAYEEALSLLRKAAVADLRRPEPWHAMGLIYERLGQRKSAAYCYFIASDMQTNFAPARQALRRMGYLDID